MRFVFRSGWSHRVQFDEPWKTPCWVENSLSNDSHGDDGDFKIWTQSGNVGGQAPVRGTGSTECGAGEEMLAATPPLGTHLPQYSPLREFCKWKVQRRRALKVPFIHCMWRSTSGSSQLGCVLEETSTSVQMPVYKSI